MKTRIVKRKKGYLVQKRVLFFFWSCAVWNYTPLDAFKVYFETYEEAEKARMLVDSGKSIGTVTPRAKI